MNLLQFADFTQGFQGRLDHSIAAAVLALSHPRSVRPTSAGFHIHTGTSSLSRRLSVV